MHEAQIGPHETG